MVYWIMGLSASGKTTLGKHLFYELRKSKPNVVFVDGDHVRVMFMHDVEEDSHTVKGRKKNAERIRELCLWLDKQDIHVVCCILSIFEESREWNRKCYSKYFEVYMDVSMEKLKQREFKGLYLGAEQGKIKNVVGVDIPYNPPANVDYVVYNEEDDIDMREIACDILKKGRMI